MQKRIGVMGAMPEEVTGLARFIDARHEKIIGDRIYYTGKLCNIEVVLVFSRWGKVAAASTVSTLIHQFNISGLLFTGVAGAIDASLKIGDIVIAEKLVQHDMDARPIMPRFEIPLTGKTWFETDTEFNEIAYHAILNLIYSSRLTETVETEYLNSFGINKPSLLKGIIASGDQFISSNEKRESLKQALPGLLCVEMEGAAVAQVCHENNLPFTIVRIISDKAGDESAIDFPLFVSKVASSYSVAIVKEWLSRV